MSSQSPAYDSEVAELEKEVPKQLEVEKPQPEEPDSKEDVQTAATELGQLPTPGATIPDDYSDAPSNVSENSAKARRKQRGGRRQRQQAAQAMQDAEHERFEEQEGRGKQTLPEIKRQSTNSRIDTGLKTFNIRRGSGSGGRPFGISLEGGDSDSKKVKSKVKPKNKSRRKVRCDTCGRKGKKAAAEENWESDDSSEETEEEEQKKEEELPKQKPFAIRLELNLDVEIFLRAKIKGDVTITFLQ